MNNINNIIGWWLAYSQGWIDAYRARLGVSLRSPALRESVTRRFPAIAGSPRFPRLA